MNSSPITKLSIVVFIIIVISGKHDGLSDAKYRISVGHGGHSINGPESVGITGYRTIGKREGLGEAKYRICYETHFANFCADLQPFENVTSQNIASSLNGNFSPNLVLHVPNVTKLDLSMNAISRLRFYDSGTVDLEAHLPCLFLKSSLKKSDKKCELKIRYFQYKYPEKLTNSKDINVTKSIQTLILRDNSIQNLRNTFSPLENLEHLDLSYNLIENVSDDVFANNSKLVTLELNNNLIESLSKETFEHLRNLQTLDLSSNRFAQLNLDIFEYLSDLLVLKISDNFHSANGPQQSSSFIFSAGQKFERLEMTGTSLSKIPIVLTRSIRELDLSNNSLFLIQCGEMDSYPLLQRLNLRNNKLETVEEDSLGRLEYLMELNLHGNSLNEVPLSLPISLLRLDLGFNQVKRINKTDLGGLAHLKTLILRDNKIEYLEEGVFSPVGSLEYLDLSNNPVKILTSSVFAGPKNVINLQLSNLSEISCQATHNCTKTFPFTELERLEVLNLSSSPLLSHQMSLDQSVLPTLGHLRELNLVNTNLTQINPNLVSHLGRLQKLEVHHNPFNCSKSVVWLTEWLKNMKLNDSKESCHKNSNVSIDDSDTLSFAIIRVLLQQNETVSKELENKTGNFQITPRCFSPAALQGRSLFDMPVESSEDKKSKSQKKNDFLKLIARKPKSREPEKENADPKIKINKTKTPDKSVIPEKTTELKTAALTLIQMESKVEESNIYKSDSTNRGKSVSNSVLRKEEKGNDEIFYQNDQPDANTAASREKTGLHSQTVRNFDIMHGREIQYVTAEPDATPKNESVELSSNSQTTNSSQTPPSSDKAKEIKSINKTHIENSRSGQRNKNFDVRKIVLDQDKMGPKTEDKGDKEGAESSGKTLKNMATLQIQTSLLKTVTKSIELRTGGLEATNPASDITDSGTWSTVGMQKPRDTTVANYLTESVIIAPTIPTERVKPRIKYQDVTVSIQDQTTAKDPQTTRNTTKKTKSVDEKSEPSSRQSRKKLAKKLKDITTSQPQTLQSLTPAVDLTTNLTPNTRMKTDSSVESSAKKKKTIDENRYETRAPIGKKIEHQLVATLQSEVDQPSQKNGLNTTVGGKNKTDNASDNNGNTFHSKISRTDKKIKISNLETTGKKVEYAGRSRVNDKNDTNTGNQENKKITEATTTSKPRDVLSKREKINLQKNQKQEENSYNETTGNHDDNKAIRDKNKTIGQREKNQNGEKINKSQSNNNDADDKRNRVNGDSTQKSEATLTPIKEELRVNHNSNDEIKISVATSSENSVANANKYNSNLESSDGMDKGGSHPGMLIFLLVVSILLFTLSLMLISHWTWCKRLNMYESGDRQILEESDYEISSLTNFKDHERW